MTSQEQAESCDWGMAVLPGDKDAVCAAPSLGPDRPSQMCSSPLCSQPLGLGSVLPPQHPLLEVARPQQAGREETVEPG